MKHHLFVAASALIAGALGVPSSSAAQAVNIVDNGDFEAGAIGFSSDYTFGDVHWGETYGAYNIGTNPAYAPGAWGDWTSFGDHTSGHGLMLILNGPASPQFQPLDLWSQTVAVVPDSRYAFTFWAASIANPPAPAQLQAYVNGASLGFTLTLPNSGGLWVTAGGDWNSGSATSAKLALVDALSVEQWNDFVVDDISLVREGNTIPPPPPAIPELPTWAMMLAGLAGLGLFGRRAARNRTPFAA